MKLIFTILFLTLMLLSFVNVAMFIKIFDEISKFFIFLKNKKNNFIFCFDEMKLIMF